MVPCVGCEISAVNLLEKIGVEDEDFVQFLQRHGVLKASVNCPNCSSMCKRTPTQVTFRCHKVKVIDGVRVKCGFSQSIKADSWLSRVRLSFKKTCQFLVVWLTTPYPRQIYLTRILELSAKTVVEWSDQCREVCIRSMEMDDVDIIGGPGVTVEIDEAKLAKRKCNEKRFVRGSWIFSAIEGSTGRCFFEVVHDRSSDTLKDIILRRIAMGTTIVSDLWKGCNRIIDQQHYQDLMANHYINFIDPVTGTHDQSIERIWREIFPNVRRYGRYKTSNFGYLAEFYWKSKYEMNDRLHYFLLEMARQFDPNNS